jgi:LysR family hydrogen peroxide-inducible transcriptional activator
MEAKLAGDLYSGDLKLGIFPTLAPYLLPHILPSLKETFPKLNYFLYEEKSDALLMKLKQGYLDAIILALPIRDQDVACALLFEEEFMLAVSKNHKFNKKKVIKKNDLKGEQLLLLEDGHCLREQALIFCKTTKASESKYFRSTSIETLRNLVANGLGITLIPKLACQKSDGNLYLPFARPKPARTVGLIWRQTSARRALLQDVAMSIKKMMSNFF